MSFPLVSVVIPIFNQAPFVVETVGSAVRQTYPNLQVIVVDDGSTDGSAELLRSEFGDRITLIRQGNGGPSSAINAGIAAARGEFIALSGGDDVCVEDRVAVQLEIMGATSHDIIFSKPMLIDADGAPLPDDAFPAFFGVRPEGPLLRTLLVDGNFLCAPSAMMRRGVIEKIGMFRLGLVQLQDYDYWLRASAAGLSLAEVEPRVVRYRRHSANLSARTSGLASIAETIPVIKSVLDRGEPAVLRSAFPYLFEPVVELNSPLTLFDKALLLLSHPRDEIKMVGAEYAIQLFDDVAFAEKSKRVGFNLLRFVQNAL